MRSCPTILWLFGLVMTLASCSSNNSLTPKSGGELYDVLLVGDRQDIVAGALQTDVPGLPQSEPQFDVSSISHRQFNSSLQYSRNIIFVNVNSKRYKTLSVSFKKDVWAEPQQIAYINTPSVKMLKDSIGSIADTLLSKYNRSEMEKALSMLKGKRNIDAEKKIKKMFGINLWVPIDFVKSKQDKGFLWLSNDAPTIMKNIVVCKLPESGDYTDEVDSILSANIKGETDSMSMRIVAASVMKRGSLYRALWEMTGDDMGGPLVYRRVECSDFSSQRGKVAVIGFVFAPGKKKRNAVRQLEAALYSIEQ